LTHVFISDPRVVARSNPGLKLANAFGVSFNFKLMHYQYKDTE